MSSEHEGADVLAAVRSGDEAAFGVIAERYRRQLHVHCYRMLGSVRWLLQNHLLDELNLIVPPIVVGHGRHLFDGGSEQRIKLVDCKAFSTGVLSLTYAPATN